MLIPLTLDIEKGSDAFSTLDEMIELRQGDALAYVLDVSLKQGGQTFNLTGYTVRMYARLFNGDIVIDGHNVQVTDAAQGCFRYSVPKELTKVAGEVIVAYFRITEGETSEYSASTEAIGIEVRRGVTLKFKEGDYFPEFDAMMADLEADRVKYSQAEDRRAATFEVWTKDHQEALKAEAQRKQAEQARVAAEQNRAAVMMRLLALMGDIPDRLLLIERAIDALGALHDEHDLMLLVRTLHMGSKIAEMVDGEIVITGEYNGSGTVVTGALYR